MTNVYCIDSSSLIDMQRYYPIKRVQKYWSLLDGLVQNGRLIAPLEVFKEIAKPYEPYPWCHGHRKAKRLFISRFQGKYTSVQKIISECPGLIDPNKPTSTQADPYVIALVQYAATRLVQSTLNSTRSRNTYIVLTEEQGTGNTNKYKIPDACKKYNIAYYSMRKLLDLENWTL
ncbi:MAG TPA: DUF4411 family protein [Candidatus Acidoferrum sp.]|nr:DUF4411 family protein [Candidatus Acidoferrum sp.]